MSSGWQPIATAPKNDERILVSGGTWIRGNKQTLPQSFPCLVMWDETEWLICDNEGPRALIRGRSFGWRFLLHSLNSRNQTRFITPLMFRS